MPSPSGRWACGRSHPRLAATKTVTLKSTKGDQATITLNKQTKNALKKNHIAFKTNKPAKRKGNNATFPEKAGKWNFANTSGNVDYNGVTRFVRGKRSVKLTKLGFTRTVKGKKSTATLNAFFGKKKVTLLTLTGKVKVKMKGAKETVSGFTAKLSKKAASLLNSRLKHKTFKANQKIGSFSLTLTSRATLITKPAPPARRASRAPTRPASAWPSRPRSRAPWTERPERHAAWPRGQLHSRRAERSHPPPGDPEHGHRAGHRWRAGGLRPMTTAR